LSGDSYSQPLRSLVLRDETHRRELTGKVGTEVENTSLTCGNIVVSKCGGIMQAHILGMEEPSSDVKDRYVG
jgi:hypothetical protein